MYFKYTLDRIEDIKKLICGKRIDLILNIFTEISSEKAGWVFENHVSLQRLAKDFFLLSNFQKLIENSTNESYKNVMTSKLNERMKFYIDIIHKDVEESD